MRVNNGLILPVSRRPEVCITDRRHTREEFFDLFGAYNGALWPVVVLLWMASAAAGIWLLQAALFLWSGVVRGHLSVQSSRTRWTPVGWLLIAYALVYPAVNAIERGSVLRIPVFGVPCPTTIFTAGLLLLTEPRATTLALVPIIWSAI